jgi:valyl-tRNA synthetase
LEVVERFGADALRYTVVAGAAVGTDIQLNYENLEEAFAPGRNFANKLWNAGRFALMNLGKEPVRRLEDMEAELELADRWILSRLSRTTEKVDAALEVFRVHEAAETLHAFFWGELADWYLELIKGRMQGDAGDGSREAAKATLVVVLDGVLRLLHPIMPFITEALWRRLPWPEGDERAASLMIAPWPGPAPERASEAAEASMQALQELITSIRSIRSEYDVPARAGIRVELTSVSPSLRTALEAEDRSLRRLATVGEVAYTAGGGDRGGGAYAVLKSGAELFVPLEKLIDIDRERDRLQGELDRVRGLRTSTEKRLRNEQFVTRAPAQVVEREREKAESFREQEERLSRKLAALT